MKNILGKKWRSVKLNKTFSAIMSTASSAVITAVIMAVTMAVIILSVFVIRPQVVSARECVGGYDALGISEGVVESRFDDSIGIYLVSVNGKVTVEFQEYTLVTGEPILVKGTMTVEKQLKDETRITTRYVYNLVNIEREVHLTRDVQFESIIQEKGNNQTVIVTRIDINTRRLSERIDTAGASYTLRSMDFTRTSLEDASPSVLYYSGNSWYKKVYEVSGGRLSSQSGIFVTIEATGEFYGFDQHWGSSHVEETDFTIERSDRNMGSTDADNWMASAIVRKSQSTITNLQYYDNQPDAISFRGGFLEIRRNDNILEISARMPEFDVNGKTTDNIVPYKESSKIETFPMTKRLASPNIRQVRGHWAEDSIAKLFGLEVFKNGSTQFNPDQYITRGEFAAALVEAAKKIPEDPWMKMANARPKTTGSRGKNQVITPIFTDVDAEHMYFSQIEEAYNRGMMNPTSANMFSPNGEVTVASAAVAMIRAIGLESLASYHGAITNYSDDNGIPDYARDALYVCEYIGLLKGDGNGRIYPNKVITRGEAAVMLDRLVEYMRENIWIDYRDRIMDY